VRRVNEASRLRAVDGLGECAVEEGILDVELVHGPTPRNSQSQHGPDGGRLDDEAEGLVVVHPGALSEPLEDPTSLVTIKRAIRLELVLEDPLTGVDIGPRRPRNQVSRAVRQQGIVLLHSTTPMGVRECARDRGRDRRQCRGSGSGRELMTIYGLGDLGSTTGDHRVGVAGVTSHDGGVVDRRHDVRGLRRGDRMSPLVHQWGSMKREAEVARGAGVGVEAGRGVPSGSEVSTVEEG
jgi:hypothetical protein